MKLSYFFLIVILLIASFLRFYKVDQIPHGLYIDEVSIGYNAYTILTKGVDEHGVSYPLFFRAFGEYKMPVSIYLTSASIAIFGKNDFVVRLPSAAFGVLSVFLIYLLVKKLLKTRNARQERFWTSQNDETVALFSAFLLAITPWHIQFSRAHFEANIALFLYLFGGLLFLYFLQSKRKVLLVSSFILFLLTVYTYNAYRLIAPVTLLACFLYVYRSLPHIRKFLLMTSVATFLFFIPMIMFSLTPEGAERFSSQSAFTQFADLSPVQKIFVYPTIYLENYLSYFSLNYLFISGDGNGRHSVTAVGNLFRFEFIFFLVGGFFLFQKRKEFFAKIIFFLLFLAPATAAFTSPSPHSLRSFMMVLPLTVIIAYGIVSLWNKKILFKKLLFFGIFLFVVYEICLYLHLYYFHYPMRTAPDWGGAYKEVIFEATKLQQQYPHIVVNDNVGMINSYRNFYNDKLAYELVNDDWIKNATISGILNNEKILYITSSNEKRNVSLKNIQRVLLKDIELKAFHNGIFAQFWEL